MLVGFCDLRCHNKLAITAASLCDVAFLNSLLWNQTSFHLLYSLASLSHVQVPVLVLVFRFVVLSNIVLLRYSHIGSTYKTNRSVFYISEHTVNSASHLSTRLLFSAILFDIFRKSHGASNCWRSIRQPSTEKSPVWLQSIMGFVVFLWYIRHIIPILLGQL